jgi:hypothetical protein
VTEKAINNLLTIQYLLILMIEVITDHAEFSSSNALIEWFTAVCCSRLRTHGGHAFEGGTIAMAMTGPLRASRVIRGSPRPGKKDSPSRPQKLWRQGIVSRCRHVAPALLLC